MSEPQPKASPKRKASPKGSPKKAKKDKEKAEKSESDIKGKKDKAEKPKESQKSKSSQKADKKRKDTFSTAASVASPKKSKTGAASKPVGKVDVEAEAVAYDASDDDMEDAEEEIGPCLGVDGDAESSEAKLVAPKSWVPGTTLVTWEADTDELTEEVQLQDAQSEFLGTKFLGSSKKAEESVEVVCTA